MQSIRNSILVSKEISIINIDIPKKWVGKSLLDLNLRKNYAINIIIGIQRGDAISIDINPTEPLTEDSSLVVILQANKVKKLMKDIG